MFGDVTAQSFTIVSGSMIRAVTPANFPGSVSVSLSSPQGVATLPNGFTYLGKIEDAFEVLLLPLFTGPVSGAFGSQFATFLSLWNTAGNDIPVFAFRAPPCNFDPCIIPDRPLPIVLKARYGAPMRAFERDGNPGKLLYVPKGAFDRLAANLRAADVTRDGESFGTQIPIARQSDFRTDFLALIDIPSSANFRITLRIYSLDAQASVHVRLIDSTSVRVESEMDVLLANPTDMYHPGYAQLGGLALPSGGRIEITPESGKRVWAMASITSNDTQQITVVAPH